MSEGRGSAEDEIVTLPFYVRMAGGALALAGLLGMILGAQLLLLGGGRSDELTLVLGASIALGVASIGAAMWAARGKAAGAFVGVVVALLLVPCALYPLNFGIVAVTMFAVAGLGGVSALLLLVSVPACIKFTRYQKSLVED